MPDFTIIQLITVDSTNNYAMQLIDADKAQHGLTVTAQTQQAGKGQRGKTWIDIPGQSLLMSIIVTPTLLIRHQFAFNAAITVAIADVLQKIYANWNIHIKWPNDIIINDKKAGGVLIENVIRGSNWTHSVIGLGLNVMQDAFPPDIPFATSLKIASGAGFHVDELRDAIRNNILLTINTPSPPETSMTRYNEYLYRRGQNQRFRHSGRQWEAIIIGVGLDGTMEVQLTSGEKAFYHHGQAEWVWG